MAKLSVTWITGTSEDKPQ